MKKVLCMCLAFCLMLTAFAGCGKSDSVDGDNDNKINNRENINSKDNISDNNTKNKVDKKRIIHTKGYENGIAYVVIANEGKITSYPAFIDENGNILFEAKGFTYNEANPISEKGITLLYDNDMINYICDIKNGRIITAQELGGTNIVQGEYELLGDGYVLVEKVETAYNGSTKSIAIFNDRMEEVYSYSKELYNFLYESDWGMDRRYSNGYIYSEIYSDNGYFNINTGEFGNNITEIPTSVREENSNEIWTSIFNKSDKFVNIYEQGEFINGYAPVVFKTEDVYYFTIVDKSGDFCFDPVVTKGNYICGSAGEYVVVAWDGQGDSYIEIFNTSGKVTEIAVEIENFHEVELTYSENIISIVSGVHTFDTYERSCEFYNEDGTKLF